MEPDPLDRLADAIALGDRFYLFVAVAPEQRAVGAALEGLRSRLATRDRVLRVRRLPDVSLGPEPNFRALVTAVIEPLLAGSDADTLVVVDTTWGGPAASGAWRSVLQRLNELRNTVAGQNHGPLLLCVEASQFATLAASAPDLWSIRRGLYDLPSTAERASRTDPIWQRLLRAFGEPNFWDSRDPAKVLTEVDAQLAQIEGRGP